jgi:putative tryptophan/tyrosine transport system substrate-binding protein
MKQFWIFDFGFWIRRFKGKKELCLALSALLLALCLPAAAQPPAKVFRIGYLSLRNAIEPHEEAFLKGLRDLGYIDGQNILIEWRFAKGNAERFGDFAAELVRLKVDVIVAPGVQAVRAAKQSTTTIPIIFPTAGDAVASGLVASLARPGGNITGLTILSPELSGKRLELLKEAFPRLSRVAVLLDSRQPPLSFKETQTTGQSLRIKLQFLEVRDAADVESVFSAMSRERADALVTLPHPVLQVHQKRIVELAAKSRVPAMYQAADWVERGGLMSYGPDHLDNYRRAAVFVDKILKGTKPAEIPVEQPTKFEFIINLKTAKQIGVTIPPNVLARADRVIR